MSALTAGRKAWFLALARRYVRRRLRRGFDGVHVEGLDRARARLAEGPAFLALNHLCWWDAFVVVALDEALGTESYCLMDAANLQKLPFFRWIGAIELDRQRPKVALRDLKASAGLADRPGRALWMFPQGEHTPAHLRPMGLKAGITVLTKAAPEVPVIPVSMNHLYREAPEPSIVLSFGEPIDARQHRGRALLPVLEEALVAGLARCDGFALGESPESFQPLLPSRHEARVPLLGKLLAQLGKGSPKPPALPVQRGEHA